MSDNVTACGIMHPRCCRPATGRQHRGCIIPQAVNTQSSAPEDERDYRPKHVELIGIINKPLLLHLVCVYVIYNSSWYRHINRVSQYIP